MAIGDVDDEVLFYVRHDKDTHSISENTTATVPKGQSMVRVRMARVESLVKDGLFAAPSFVKIDVEGAELEVIRGIGGVSVAGALIEVHPEELKASGTSDPHGAVLDELRKRGFDKFEYLDDDHVFACRKDLRSSSP